MISSAVAVSIAASATVVSSSLYMLISSPFKNADWAATMIEFFKVSIINSNRLPGQSGKFSKPFGGLEASQTVVLGGKAVRGGINARSTNDLPLHLGRGICDRALYAHGMSFHPGRTVCDTLAPRKVWN